MQKIFKKTNYQATRQLYDYNVLVHMLVAFMSNSMSYLKYTNLWFSIQFIAVDAGLEAI